MENKHKESCCEHLNTVDAKCLLGQGVGEFSPELDCHPGSPKVCISWCNRVKVLDYWLFGGDGDDNILFL